MSEERRHKASEKSKSVPRTRRRRKGRSPAKPSAVRKRADGGARERPLGSGEILEIPADEILLADSVDPRYRTTGFVEQLMVEVEGLQADEPERAKSLASAALRLASRLSNTTFARAWDLWAVCCQNLGHDERAEGARAIAGLFDSNLSVGTPGRGNRARARRDPKKAES